MSRIKISADQACVGSVGMSCGATRVPAALLQQCKASDAALQLLNGLTNSTSNSVTSLTESILNLHVQVLHVKTSCDSFLLLAAAKHLLSGVKTVLAAMQGI